MTMPILSGSRLSLKTPLASWGKSRGSAASFLSDRIRCHQPQFQGLTAERVLVNADTGVHPDLLNSRFGYVSISRDSHEATVTTRRV
jgi:hypothetical protein